MIQSSKFATFRSPRFILGLLLFVFFLKGVFLSVIQPIFGGQDESRHYNTVQYLSEPKDRTGLEIPKPDTVIKDKDTLSTYHYSEEIRNTATAFANETIPLYFPYISGSKYLPANMFIRNRMTDVPIPPSTDHDNCLKKILISSLIA